MNSCPPDNYVNIERTSDVSETVSSSVTRDLRHDQPPTTEAIHSIPALVAPLHFDVRPPQFCQLRRITLVLWGLLTGQPRRPWPRRRTY
jgi:hypothetical protein